MVARVRIVNSGENVRSIVIYSGSAADGIPGVEYCRTFYLVSVSLRCRCVDTHAWCFAMQAHVMGVLITLMCGCKHA